MRTKPNHFTDDHNEMYWRFCTGRTDVMLRDVNVANEWTPYCQGAIDIRWIMANYFLWQYCKIKQAH